MKIIFSIIVCILIVFVSITQAQDTNENYNVYIAQYDEGIPGSTVFREDLIEIAPLKDYEFILITGLKYKVVQENGFPETDVLDLLNEAGDKLAEELSKKLKYIFAGAFTSNGERLEYFYIKNEEGVKEFVEEFYEKNYPKEDYYLNVRADKDWKAYLDFLYPNPLTRNYMTDGDVINKLIEVGDVLVKERRVDHWAYFKTKEDMKTFKEKLIALNFQIAGTDKNKSSDFPFKIQFWRNDKVDMASINPITSKLLQIASDLNGDYDGWETIVVKE